MTYVKICGLAELQHAVSALEAGADMLGFVFAPSRRQIAPESAANVLGECRRLFPPELRPWHAVGVFADQPIALVLAVAARCRLDVVQLSGQESEDYCRQVMLPVFKAVHVRELLRGNDRGAGARPLPPGASESPRGPAPDGALPPLWDLAHALHQVKAASGAARLLLDSGGPGRWGGTGETFQWTQIGGAARECLVAGGLDPTNVAEAIATMRPWGVDVSSGVERGGRKDPELIRQFIHEVRGIDDRY